MHPTTHSEEHEKFCENIYGDRENTDELEARLYGEIYYSSESADIVPEFNPKNVLDIREYNENHMNITENITSSAIKTHLTAENVNNQYQNTNTIINILNEKNKETNVLKTLQKQSMSSTNSENAKQLNKQQKLKINKQTGITKNKEQRKVSKNLKEISKKKLMKANKNSEDIALVQKGTAELPRNLPVSSEEDSNFSTIENASLSSAETIINENQVIAECSSVNQNIVQNELIINNEPENQDGTLGDVIDLLSDSSKDSVDENDKYNVTTKDKKMSKSSKYNVNVESNSDSESDESIFEIPVPPKPAPLVISLEESDEDESDSDNEPVQNNQVLSNTIQNLEANKKRLNDANHCCNENSVPVVNNLEKEDDIVCINDDCADISETANVSMDTQIQGDIILNHTEVQRGASSLSEIKQLRNSTTNANVKETSVNILSRCDRNVSNSISKKRTHRDAEKEDDSLCYFQPMSQKMQAFYNNSWGGENFDLEEIYRKMPKDRKRWAVLDEDVRSACLKTLNRYWGQKCGICQRTGHKKNNCPEARKILICCMCGVEGHRETRCPHRMCLTCGKKQSSYTKTCTTCQTFRCTVCRSVGHKKDNCPDLWRRYHHTIIDEGVNIPENSKNIMKPPQQLSCCNCTKRGHDASTCKRYRWSSHFPTPAFVSKYADNNTNQTREVLVPNPCNFSARKNIMDQDKSCTLEPCQQQPKQTELPSAPGISEFNKTNNNIACSNVTPLGSTSTSKDQVFPQSKNQVILSFYEILMDKTVKTYTMKLKNLRDCVSTNIRTHNLNLEFPGKLRVYVEYSMQFLSNLKNKFWLRVSFRTPPIPMMLRTLLSVWAQRTPEEQGKMIILPTTKDMFINAVQEKLQELKQLQLEPNFIYNETHRLMKALKNYRGSRNVQEYQSLFKQYWEQKRQLIMSLHKFKYIKKSEVRIRELECVLLFSKQLEHPDTQVEPRFYIKALYYVNIMFTPYDMRNIEDVLNRGASSKPRCKQSPLLLQPPRPNIYNAPPLVETNYLINSPFIHDTFEQNNSEPDHRFSMPSHTIMQLSSDDPFIRPIPPLMSASTEHNHPQLPSLDMSINNQLKPFKGIHSQTMSMPQVQNINQMEQLLYCSPVQNTNKTKEKTEQQQQNRKIRAINKRLKKACRAIKRAKNANAPELNDAINILMEQVKKPAMLRSKDIKTLNVRVNTLEQQRKNKRKGKSA